MPNDDPRICIIGAGNLATRRIYPYIGAAGGQLVGVCDLNAERAATNARRFGGTPYTDLDAMLSATESDGVIICVGPGAHAELAQKVLRRGFPVYTEKPPALTAVDALQVARAASAAGLLCMTAFKKRYAAAYTRARAFINEFTPADRLSISIDYASAEYPNDRPERSFLLDFGIHAIDLVAFLFGDVHRVYATTRDEHAFAVSLTFADGAVGAMNLVDGRSFSVPTEEVEVTLRGGNAITVHNSSTWRILRDGTCTEWREPPTFTSAGDSGNDTGHLAELVAFLTALRGGDPPPSTIYESYKSMVLYEAILASARHATAVDVSYAVL